VTIFDLLFVLVFLATAGCLLTIAVLAIIGRGGGALHLLRIWATGAAIYFTALLSVSFAQPQRVLQLGEIRCLDDWCLTVDNAQRTAADGTARYVVSFTLSSQARRVSQRALDASVYLIDDSGRHYQPLPDPSAVPFDVLLHPGESIPTTRTFQLPEDARQVGLIVNHGSGPANFVIGDEHSFFHKRTIVKLP
jgi:hypothetical protein